MSRLEKLKEIYKTVRIDMENKDVYGFDFENLEDMEWLIEKVDQQNIFIKELRDKVARFEKYWEIAEKQHIELEEKVKYWETNYYVKESLSLELSSKLQSTEQKLEAMYRMVLSDDSN